MIQKWLPSGRDLPETQWPSLFQALASLWDLVLEVMSDPRRNHQVRGRSRAEMSDPRKAWSKKPPSTTRKLLLPPPLMGLWDWVDVCCLPLPTVAFATHHLRSLAINWGSPFQRPRFSTYNNDKMCQAWCGKNKSTLLLRIAMWKWASMGWGVGC